MSEKQMKAEPIQDVHQLAHTELFTPVLERTPWNFLRNY